MQRRFTISFLYMLTLHVIEPLAANRGQGPGVDGLLKLPGAISREDLQGRQARACKQFIPGQLGCGDDNSFRSLGIVGNHQCRRQSLGTTDEQRHIITESPRDLKQHEIPRVYVMQKLCILFSCLGTQRA